MEDTALETTTKVTTSPETGSFSGSMDANNTETFFVSENSALESRIDVQSDYADKLEQTFTGTSTEIGIENNGGENSNSMSAEATTTGTSRPLVDDFDAQMKDYLTTQDPETMLGSLRDMDTHEIDRVIEEIEKGDLDSVKKSFEVEKVEGGVVAPEKLPATALKFKPEIASDSQRYEHLKEILGIDEEETFMEIEETPERVPVEAPPIPPTIVESKEHAHNSEKIIEQKVGGTVIYDLKGGIFSLHEVPVVLVEDKLTGIWSLPEFSLEDELSEKKQIEESVEASSGIEPKMDEEIEREKESSVSKNGTKYEEESVFFSAIADSEKPLTEKTNYKWLTFGEIVDQKLDLDEHSVELLKKAGEMIKKEIEEKKRG